LKFEFKGKKILSQLPNQILNGMSFGRLPG